MNISCNHMTVTKYISKMEMSITLYDITDLRPVFLFTQDKFTEKVDVSAQSF